MVQSFFAQGTSSESVSFIERLQKSVEPNFARIAASRMGGLHGLGGGRLHGDERYVLHSIEFVVWQSHNSDFYNGFSLIPLKITSHFCVILCPGSSVYGDEFEQLLPYYSGKDTILHFR